MTYKQPTEEQFRNIMSNYWTMMKELESIAHNNNDTMLKRWVEGYYQEWNSIVTDNKNLVPVWKEGE